MRRMFFAVVVFTGCGGTQGLARGGAEADRPVCADEVSTGTNINRVVCRRRSEVDAEHSAAQEWRMRNGSDPTKGGVHTTRDPFSRSH